MLPNLHSFTRLVLRKISALCVIIVGQMQAFLTSVQPKHAVEGVYKTLQAASICLLDITAHDVRTTKSSH